MKAIEKSFLVVLFIMLYKVVSLTFETMDEIPQYNHPKQTKAFR